MPNITNAEPVVLPPGVKSVTIPEQKVFDGQVFPLILYPEWEGARDWKIWLVDNIETIKKLVYKFGAILFRGFTIDSAQSFDDFCKGFGFNEYNYHGNFANRTPVVGHVYTANDAERRIIPFHHELVHCIDVPTHVFFYCDVPATVEGETPIVLSNIVYREMAAKEPDFVRRLHKDEVCGVRVMPDEDDKESYLGTSWKSALQVKTREEAEKVATEAGYFDHQWQSNGALKTKTRPLPGFRIDKKSGKVMFFNTVHIAYEGLNDRHNTEPKKASIFRNGDYMPARAMDNLKEALWSNSVQFKWQAGDVLVVDNIQVQHARNDFRGPRKVLVSMYQEEVRLL